MKGKDKCKILKEIRAQIAAANDIAWGTENCTHKGECSGTCPRCEAEVAALERELAQRKAQGKTAHVMGLSAGLIATSDGDGGGVTARSSTENASEPVTEGSKPDAPLMGVPIPVVRSADYTRHGGNTVYLFNTAKKEPDGLPASCLPPKEIGAHKALKKRSDEGFGT